MKVKVEYTVDVRDDYRRAINLYYGRPGLATREQVRHWLESHGSSEDENLMYSLHTSVMTGEDDDR